MGSIRAIWAVQDKLALDAGQEKLIELKREMVNGAERTVWNPALSIPPEDLEFSDVETARLTAAIQTWDQYNVAADRRWLEPSRQLSDEREPTGNPPANCRARIA